MTNNQALMNNKYFNFDYIEFKNNKVINPTELCILPGIPDKYKSNNYILLKTIEDNRLLESISFELYETTDYWDLLMVLNEMSNTSDLPVDNDIILELSKNEIVKWFNHGKFQANNSIVEQYDELMEIIDESIITLKYTKNNPKEMIKRKYLEILEELKVKNEKYRNFKYISLSDMTNLEADILLNSNKYRTPKNIAGIEDEISRDISLN